ncbi:bifunctional aminoglycoside phosphotransferase/ATP-binding protein [Ancylobacter amanitiformis]|uniref:Aminoglycoside phosphotransferase family enzyme/predicted kinase n=1 Tax=Ancylobacter amanitiformis TaxID=217069 RepID=A0ABU0LR93_9HYPH|nr:bifunctional aminoglycoside phosphotransferase/ATP-binding protein [Ancylobacter amanitiformis]MDQ0511205.1 aminoglycoside phosphotransferase family enzyme/predicted kinase [Ancylobacter amanitiformis]
MNTSPTVTSPALSPADHVVADQQPVFALLADPATHGITGPVRRIDTHGAVVFLAGKDVYKIKRAVRFPFMDLSTLERRHGACQRELEVNRDNAPGLYLGLVPIVAREGGLHLGGAGDIVEWAVHMRRFDEEATLDHVAARGGLDNQLIDALAQAVAAAHERAPRHREWDAPAALARVAAGIVDGLRETPDLFAPARVAALGAALAGALGRLAPLLAARARRGEVRRCHGDLHLRNIALIAGVPVLFDALEFDEALATIDLLYDLAFLLMDLGTRGEALAANRLLNAYLKARGGAPPYDGLEALPLFIALRAGIRAQVSAAALAHRTGPVLEAGRAEALSYLAFAEVALTPVPARLVAIGGLSGTGKSTLASHLAPVIGPLPGAVHLRSDVERKRLAGVGEFDRLPPQAYTMEATEEVYATLRARAAAVLASGHGVVVDAVHQRPEERAALAEVAQRAGAGFSGLWLEAPVAALAARVEARSGDASDATVEVVRHQAERAVGPLDWLRLSATGTPDEVLARAQAALGRAVHR